MSTDWLEISEGNTPLVLSIPHTGLTIPDEIAQQLQCDKETALADTDWWVDKLYSFAPELGITVVRSHISRTVIDLNRDPSGVSLYPGQTTTQLARRNVSTAYHFMPHRFLKKKRNTAKPRGLCPITTHCPTS